MWDSKSSLLRDMENVMKIYEKYLGDIIKMNIFLYVVVNLDSQFKLYDKTYGLTLALRWKWTDFIASKVKEDLDALINECSMIRDGNILTPTPYVQPFLEVRVGKNVGRSGLKVWRKTPMPIFIQKLNWSWINTRWPRGTYVC